MEAKDLLENHSEKVNPLSSINLQDFPSGIPQISYKKYQR